MTKKVWFQTAIAIVLTLIIVTLLIHVSGLFSPVAILISTIFIPLLGGGLLYYITQPIQNLLERRGLSRIASTIVIFLIIIMLIGIFSSIIFPFLVQEFQSLMRSTPTIQREMFKLVDTITIQLEEYNIDIENPLDQLLGQVYNVFSMLASNAISIVTGTINVLLTLFLIPFFFFFMLKDHERFIPAISKPFSGQLYTFVVDLFNEIDETIKAFVQGQVVVSSILATLIYIGYSIIGLEYALLLAIFALFMNVIPFIGPWIAYFPAAILALIQDPIMIIWVSIITIIAQQIDGNLITPNVIGQSLNMHPLTIITIVLAAGKIAGFVGMLIALPAYAVVKVIIQNIYKYRAAIKLHMLKNIE